MSDEKESESIRVPKIIVGAVITLTLGAVSTAAKSVIDVVELKTKVQNYEDNARDMKDDIKEIKQDVKTLLTKGG